jgi:hypothetical protein
VTAPEVYALVQNQIGDRWGETNLHQVNLRKSVVSPQRMRFICRRIKDGEIVGNTMDAWLVLEERPDTRDGYKIIYDEETNMFGLASPGWDTDPHPSVDGFYGDFWSAFKGM